MRQRSLPLVLIAVIVTSLVFASGGPVVAAVGPPSYVRTMSPCYPPADIGCFQVSIDGLGVGANDDVYTASGLIRRVKWISSTGTPISFWGPSGSGFTFDSASALAIDSNGDVLVLDQQAIHRFSSTGVWKTTYSDGNRFVGPRSIAVAPGGTIYVSIIGSILYFSETGTYLGGWAVDIGFGASPGLAVGVDSSHDVYVSDPGHNQILRYSNTGTPVASFGSAGAANGQFSSPKGVAVAPSGDVYVVDSGNSRVQRFASDGTFVTTWGTPGFGNGQFTSPAAIAIGASGVIVIGDGTLRIQQFRYTTPLLATLDVDVSITTSKYDALTDGLLIIRYMSGLTGTSLTNGALGGTATRIDPIAIKNYLDGIRTSLDIDNNNTVDALTDGLLIMRYLFGLRGSALIDGAFDPLGSRHTAADIETYIQTLMP